MAAETANLYQKLTGRENLELFVSLYGGAVCDPIELLNWVGLADAVDRRVGTYSKGMGGSSLETRKTDERRRVECADRDLNPTARRSTTMFALRLACFKSFFRLLSLARVLATTMRGPGFEPGP